MPVKRPLDPKAADRKIFDVTDLASDRKKALELVPVSRETLERLDRFVAELMRWQPTINLVAPSTIPHLWTRHVADSLQLIAHAPDARAWVDLGSGAGFPGMAIACALADELEMSIHLVESDTRKAAFLREAARASGVRVRIEARRIESISAAWADPIEVVTARALAPMTKLLEWTAPFLQKGAKALFLKGQDVEAELTEAAKSWNIQAELQPSVTNPDARVVIVRRAERVRNHQAD
jgi:16S rRNA (guanine527-N7)-methyltransferase